MQKTPENKSKHFHLTDDQKLAWLRLFRSQNVGPATFRDLISFCGSASAAIDALPELALRGGAAARIRVCTEEDAVREMDRVSAIGARMIALGEPEYPPALRSFDQSPPLICVRGNRGIIQKNCVGIVGSRNASIAGLKLSQRFASGIGSAGYPVVSGLARGIDTAAHRASINTGTVAVFAGGIDHVFPDENAELAAAIIDNGGAIISEMPFGWQPRAKDFPRRNRIVAGMCLGVVVIEAARRSGSLITARLANEMGRIVMAVPGSPLDPRSEGANSLIKNGASLVTAPDDVIEAIAPIDPDAADFIFDIHENEKETGFELINTTEGSVDCQGVRRAVISQLGAAPVMVDDIVCFSGYSVGQIQMVLLELALAGRIERHPGNRVSLVQGD